MGHFVGRRDLTGEVTTRRVSVGELLDLRHAVLRAGLPREAASFPGDEVGTTRHYGAFLGDKLVCCATLLRSEWQGEPAWQLRGMATALDVRRQGVGRRVIELLEREVRADRGTLLLWCNARVPAAGFYRAMGWQVVSERFDIPTAGPHVKMIKRVSPDP